MNTAMRAYSAWSAAMGVALLAGAALLQGRWGEAAAESLYLYALALFHGIYAIWFRKGAALPAFARASVAGRLAIATAYLVAALLLARGGSALDAGFRNFLLAYLLIQATADIASAIRSGRELPETTGVAVAPLSVEARNRFLFASYLSLLAIWMLLATGGFIEFFRLPRTLFPGWHGALFGPIHLLAAQVLLLAGYNFVAVLHRLQPLIEAGVRGGLVTCVFFLALVALGLPHPLTLLLPAVDLLSVAWIFFARLGRRSPAI
jgi:hypothetical protein